MKERQIEEDTIDEDESEREVKINNKSEIQQEK